MSRAAFISSRQSLISASPASQSRPVLLDGGALTPSVTVTGGTGSIDGPLMIAFDGTGNLWVANGNFSGVNTVVDFTPSQLAASGTPAPTVVLSANSGSLGNPAGLAFDASGDLWVANVAGSLVEFTPSQLVTSGDPAPSATVTGTSLSGPFGLAFDPHATALPIKPEKRR
jgi:sugar lactone lactonase YvrE